VAELLAKGANIEATDNNGLTALMCAAYAGYLDPVKLLLARGAKIEATDDDGQTALFQPALNDDTSQDRPYGGDTEVTKFLLSKGANVNAVDKNGSTPLREAVDHKKTAIAMLLRANGAR
jgi:uncharacterized protein